MVALVLAERKISDFEDIILRKLEGYTKPVKTKHLAQRLKVDRSGLVISLNKLKTKGMIQYTATVVKGNDYRGREDKVYGWIIS